MGDISMFLRVAHPLRDLCAKGGFSRSKGSDLSSRFSLSRFYAPLLFRYHVLQMSPATANSSPEPRRRSLRNVVLFGLLGGLLITLLKLTEYRFLVIEHSFEIYGGLVAIIFASLGIWLGLTLTRKKPAAPPPQPSSTPFSPDSARLSALGITPRELEILGLIAAGLSNREIAERLFVSENTVKTHSSRLFDKLGARRRTQAVQLAKEARLIP